ncbi:MAG: hypothetical protein FWH05_01595 [Oscillospiraceae bacterium]|nr:hypothetical protein [Oscillospiraceae bacterium]
MKILYVVISILFITNISLSLCLIFQKPVCERLHLDYETDAPVEIDRVPDAETAKKIADIIIGTTPSYDPELYYDIYEVNFMEEDNLWQVLYHPHPGYTDDGFITSAVCFSLSFYIRKDNGMIV